MIFKVTGLQQQYWVPLQKRERHNHLAFMFLTHMLGVLPIAPCKFHRCIYVRRLLDKFLEGN